MYKQKEDKSYISKLELEENMIALMGGRAAEDIIIGDITTGASNDIERATKIARNMIIFYGMSEKIGPISLSVDNLEEIKKINESYNFVQLINSNESIIQQYFNYLNPNVSSYRNLYFNINDDDNTLDIEIKNSDGTTNAANVLSSGQLNVLAIAIFIAKNISQNSTVIDFIGIDDPIQNMDDINQFSMIDVLSQLKKQLIFTTHDVKYVNLFLKKNELRLDDISVYYLDAENDRYENILI